MIHHYICINNDTPGRTNSIHSTFIFIYKERIPDFLKGPQCSSNQEVLDKLIYRYSEVFILHSVAGI